MLRRILSNHVFANLTFLLVLVVGFISYGLLPRQQDPEMNFNWINIITILPGASAEDVERLVTEPLEEALEGVADIRFVQSASREGNSTILVRFQDMDERTFDKRMNDLRREIRNKERELPEEAEDPQILEITSANGFPTAMVVVMGQADDENLRRQARHVQKDLEGLRGVDSTLPVGLRDPELQIRFHPERLAPLRLTPSAVADAVGGRFRDLSGGSFQIGERNWLLRLEGTASDPEAIAAWPIPAAAGEVTLGQIADIAWARERAQQLVAMQGRPAILFPVTKQPHANALELTERIRAYIAERNELSPVTGVELALADDATHLVRNALGVMERNALLGLLMVMAAVWLFLGPRIALLIGLGIPFTLAGVFGLVYAVDGSLNVMALLAVVIALGMLVDDAVVVVEAIFVHLERGLSSLDAGLAALRETAAPVTTSVMTTMAAFLPLMLLPGILGKFMRVIPAVVSTALALSLVEAFWMLPAHVAAWRIDFRRPSRMHRWRIRFLRGVRRFYVRLLVRVLRRPRLSLTAALLPVAFAIAVTIAGWVRMEFFAFDALPLFYVNVEMPSGSTLERTLEAVEGVRERVEATLQPGEAQALVSYSGQMFTDTKPVFGERYGQILVSLNPHESQRRRISTIVDGMRETAQQTAGPADVSFLVLSGGPPVARAISVKVRGETFTQIEPAAEALKEIVAGLPGVSDVTDNFAWGQPQLTLIPDGAALQRAGLPIPEAMRLARLLGEGEIAAYFQFRGEKTGVRVMADPAPRTRVDGLLETAIALPGGGTAALGTLMDHRVERGIEAIRHYDHRRTITVEADLNRNEESDGVAEADRLNEESAKRRIQAAWSEVQHRFPGVNLDFSGILDDITESQDAILTLFLFGVGLMYMILGTQFGSYGQPLMILATVPMAFTGVVFGLLASGQPMSLYTLYGVVALSGIAVNASIVLISAANSRVEAGMSHTHAIVYAARRRVAPILITTLTTIAGLFSLAVGLGGRSLLWGPVATSIVWGLAVSTLLTLFIVPLLYTAFHRRRKRQ